MIEDNLTAIPPSFHGELPVKSMDLSEIGFRERYQSALLTDRKSNDIHVGRKSNIVTPISMAQSDNLQTFVQNDIHTGGNGSISNDYYMLSGGNDRAEGVS